jgi:hypothetical protein
MAFARRRGIVRPAPRSRERCRAFEADQPDLGQPTGRQLLAQAFISGPYTRRALVAWQGATLACFGWERFVAPGDKGQTAVIG